MAQAIGAPGHLEAAALNDPEMGPVYQVDQATWTHITHCCNRLHTCYVWLQEALYLAAALAHGESCHVLIICHCWHQTSC